MDTTGHPATFLRQHHDSDGAPPSTEDSVSWMDPSIDWGFTDPALDYPTFENPSTPAADGVIHVDSYASSTAAQYEHLEQLWQELEGGWFDASYDVSALHPTDPHKAIATTTDSTCSRTVVENPIPDDRQEDNTSFAPSFLWSPLQSVDGLPNPAFATAMPQPETSLTLASTAPTSGLVRGVKRPRDTDKFGAHLADRAQKKQRRPASLQAPSARTLTPALPLTHTSSSSRGKKRAIESDEVLRTDGRATKRPRLPAFPTLQGSVTTVPIAGPSTLTEASLAPATATTRTADYEPPPELFGDGSDIEHDESLHTPASPSQEGTALYNAVVRKYCAILGYPNATDLSTPFYIELCQICKAEHNSSLEIPDLLTRPPHSISYPQPTTKGAALPFDPNSPPDIPIPPEAGVNPEPPPHSPGRGREWQIRFLCPLFALQRSHAQSNRASENVPGWPEADSALGRPTPPNLVPCGTHISRVNDIDRHVIFQHLRPRSICTWGNPSGNPIELGRFDSIARHMKLKLKPDRPSGRRTGTAGGSGANKENAGSSSTDLGPQVTYDEGLALVAATSKELPDFLACQRCPRDCACWDGSAPGGRRVRDCKQARHCTACRKLLREWKRGLQRQYVTVHMPCFGQCGTRELVGLLRANNSPSGLHEWLSKHVNVVWCTCAVCEPLFSVCKDNKDDAAKKGSLTLPCVWPSVRVWSSIPCSPPRRLQDSQRKPQQRVRTGTAADKVHGPRPDKGYTLATTSAVALQAPARSTARDRNATVAVPGPSRAAPIVKIEEDDDDILWPTALEQKHAARAHEVRRSGQTLGTPADRAFLSPLDVRRELCEIRARDLATGEGIPDVALQTEHDEDAIVDAFWRGSDEEYAKVVTLPAPTFEDSNQS